MKVLLVGIVSALLGIWIHNLADPFGGHALQAMWWLEVGLVFAVCQAVAKRKASAASTSHAGRSNSARPASLVPGAALSGMPSARTGLPDGHRP
jgi:hypothetical protein